MYLNGFCQSVNPFSDCRIDAGWACHAPPGKTDNDSRTPPSGQLLNYANKQINGQHRGDAKIMKHKGNASDTDVVMSL
jgi:hypothetical protein